MKTAEMWYNEQVGRSDMGWNVELSEHEYVDHVHNIQLDAMKEGMRRAVKCVTNPDTKQTNLLEAIACGDRNRRAILDASEQLTEKDL